MKYFLTVTILLVLFRCDKVNITPAIDDSIIQTALPALSLKELDIEFKNGVPFYENASVFNQALATVSRTSASVYSEWANENNFNPDYFNLIAALERAESDQYEFSDSDLDYILPLKEGGAIQNPFNPFSRLASSEGIIYIGNDVHYFSGRKHILLDDGSAEDILNLKDLEITDINRGVYVWLYEQPNYERSSNELKVQRERFNCPFELGRSAASSFSEFDNLWWQQVIHNGGIGRTDEQKVGCGGAGCRQGTWGFLNTVMTVTNVTSTGYTISSSMMYAFDNRRRSGLNWIRTFPDVRIGGELINGGNNMSYTLQVTESNNANQSSTSNLGSETTNNLNLFGTAEENVMISDGLVVTVTSSIPNVNVILRKMIVNAGLASHKWTNRGNNPANDPIGIDFGCN